MPSVLPPTDTIATTTCINTASGTDCITQFPYNFHVQDAGNISFGLTIIIVMMFTAMSIWIASLLYKKN